MLNVVALTGRLGADPEIKTTQSGTAVLSFQIAVERNYAAQGQQRETDWIACVAWRNTAEFIGRYFHKGDMIALTGRLQTRSYEDRQGNKRTATEVVVSEVNFCGGRKEQKPVTADGFDEFEEFDDGDLPFVD